MLALVSSDGTTPADLQVTGGRYVSSGSDLATAFWLTLHTEAPAKPGDPVPAGRPQNGWWAQVYLDPDDVWGSRWWLLEGAQAVPETARRAEEYLHEALTPWIARGWASSFEIGNPTIEGATLFAPVTIVAPDGTEETMTAWAELG